MIAVAESGRQGINLRDPLGNGGDRFIDARITRWLDHFETGNATVFFDSNFHEDEIFCASRRERCRLHPFAVKTIVQNATVPAELRFTACAARVPACTRRCSLAARALNSA